MTSKYITFPDAMSLKASGGPSFQTSVATSSNGNETRNINWSIPRYFFDVAPSIDSFESLEYLVKFFNDHKGKAIPFRFKNWTNFKVNKERVELINSELKNINLANKFIRSGTLKIFSDKREFNYEVDHDSGCGVIKDFIDENEEIFADYHFDFLCRFNIDALKISLDLRQIQGMEIPVIEVRG